jgi:hypothetical protein
MTANCSCGIVQQQFAILYGVSGQMEAIVRAYIVIAALVVVAISARVHTANTSLSYDAGYKWAKQRGIDDEDFCPDRNRSFYDGCAAYIGAAYEADNGMGVPPPLSPDDDDDDSN